MTPATASPISDTASAAAAASAPLLVVNGIEVIYNHVILVLKGVSLQVPERGIVAILGGNGAWQNLLHEMAVDQSDSQCGTVA